MTTRKFITYDFPRLCKIKNVKEKKNTLQTTGYAAKTMKHNCRMNVVDFSFLAIISVAKLARKFGHAMQIINHYHYPFL